MYPTGALSALAARKRVRLRCIALHCGQCAFAGAELAKPLAWLDDFIARWRRISPLAKGIGMPFGLMLARKLTKRFRGGLKLLRFAPLIFRMARSFAQARG